MDDSRSRRHPPLSVCLHVYIICTEAASACESECVHGVSLRIIHTPPSAIDDAGIMRAPKDSVESKPPVFACTQCTTHSDLALRANALQRVH